MESEQAATELTPTSIPQLLVQLHIAEYASLLNRFTYMDGFSIAVWTILGALATIVALTWQNVAHKPLLVWLATWAALVMILQVLGFMRVQYTITLYIERDLRRRLQQVLGNGDFWHFSKFVAKIQSPLETAWEWGLPLPSAAVLGLACWLRCADWKREDYLGAAVSLILIISIIRGCAGLHKLRTRMTCPQK
jgi:hypothetical protein